MADKKGDLAEVDIVEDDEFEEFPQESE